MRRLFALLVLCPLALSAQAVSRDSVLSVTVTRSTKLAPDRAIVWFTIEGSAETPTDAIARADTKVASVINALKGLGARVTIDRPYSMSVAALAPNSSYLVGTPTHAARSTIRVQCREPELLASVIAVALGAGAMSTSNVVYESSVVDSVRRVRVIEAVAEARVEAAAIAKALGGRTGNFVDLNSPNYGNYQNPANINFDARYSSNMMPAPEVVVSVSITARFRLLP